MESVNLHKAKEIFRSYQGCHFQMAREGSYENYKKLGISRDLECTWLKEMQAEILEKLNLSSNNRASAQLFSEYGDMVSLLKDTQGHQLMLNYIKKTSISYDSNTAERNINKVLDTTRIIGDKKLKSRIISECLLLLKGLLNKPIYISDNYKENGNFPDYLTPEKIKTSIENTFKYWENELKSL